MSPENSDWRRRSSAIWRFRYRVITPGHLGVSAARGAPNVTEAGPAASGRGGDLGTQNGHSHPNRAGGRDGLSDCRRILSVSARGAPSTPAPGNEPRRAPTRDPAPVSLPTGAG